jgi:hypothetical protein
MPNINGAILTNFGVLIEYFCKLVFRWNAWSFAYSTFGSPNLTCDMINGGEH